mgnify:FL=1
MGKQIDLGNNETWTVGLVQDGADWLALTLTESKTFKGRAAAEKWLAKRGYLPNGTKIQN